MRNAECGIKRRGRAARRPSIHSAFRIPHSALRAAMKVLLAGGGTGGHLIPALALAQALRDAEPTVELLLVGARRGIEAELLPRHPFRHRLLPIEPIYRRGWSRAARRGLGLDPERPTVFVFGGSQGAQALNYAVAAALERRLLGANVLWGTGAAHAEALARYAAPGRVVARGFFDSMSEPYRAADLVVSRAGAMTVAELCAWGKPSILVPLPTSAANHQTHNARALAAAGAALQLAERDLTAHTLAQLITELLGDHARLASLADRARARGHPNASREIVSRILTLVSR